MAGDNQGSRKQSVLVPLNTQHASHSLQRVETVPLRWEVGTWTPELTSPSAVVIEMQMAQ